MAKRRKVVVRTVTKPKPSAPVELSQKTYPYKTSVGPIITKLGLALGEELRFRKVSDGTGTWQNGTLTGENFDGSLNIYTGMSRSILPSACQRKLIGPRGGVTWEDLIPSIS